MRHDCFKNIQNRVIFKSYDQVLNAYNSELKMQESKWIL